MGVCTDPRLTYLNQLGYNVVRLPRKGIVPLGVIGREKKSRTWLGTIDQIWQSSTPAPIPGDPKPVAGVQGTKTNDLDLSVGLDILKNALNGMFGATAPSIDFAYKHAKSVQFAFKEVRSVGVDPFVIGNFLANGTLRAGNPFLRYFESDDTEALVVAEVLEARAIGVVAKQSASAELSVDVPQIQAALGAKVGVKTSNASNTEITFEGPEFLAFGYKPFGIRRVGQSWEIYGVAADAAHAFGVQETKLVPIVETHELVEIDFDGMSVGS
jgi:hypothetical protein